MITAPPAATRQSRPSSPACADHRVAALASSFPWACDLGKTRIGPLCGPQSSR